MNQGDSSGMNLRNGCVTFVAVAHHTVEIGAFWPD
jgi:hypothetical protein